MLGSEKGWQSSKVLQLPLGQEGRKGAKENRSRQGPPSVQAAHSAMFNIERACKISSGKGKASTVYNSWKNYQKATEEQGCLVIGLPVASQGFSQTQVRPGLNLRPPECRDLSPGCGGRKGKSTNHFQSGRWLRTCNRRLPKGHQIPTFLPKIFLGVLR